MFVVKDSELTHNQIFYLFTSLNSYTLNIPVTVNDARLEQKVTVLFQILQLIPVKPLDGRCTLGTSFVILGMVFAQDVHAIAVSFGQNLVALGYHTSHGVDQTTVVGIQREVAVEGIAGVGAILRTVRTEPVVLRIRRRDSSGSEHDLDSETPSWYLLS